jgi:hypothetical protein
MTSIGVVDFVVISVLRFNSNHDSTLQRRGFLALVHPRLPAPELLRNGYQINLNRIGYTTSVFIFERDGSFHLQCSRFQTRNLTGSSA